MALYSTSKSIGLARDLADKLIMRFKGSATIDTVRQALDAQGYPILFCSDAGVETANSPVIAIRIKNIDVGALDIFGNSTLPFAPHTCEVAYELTTGGFLTPAAKDYTCVINEVAKLGTILQEKAIAFNTAVSEASMNAANPIATFDDIDNPHKGV